MAVRESLELDFSKALSGLNTLDRRFEATAREFQASIDRAFAKIQAGASAFTVDGQVKLDGAEEATRDLDRLEAQAKETGQGLEVMAEKSRLSNDNLEKVGHTAIIVGGAILAGFAIGENAIIGFDKAMSTVAAVSDATAGQLDKLRTAAINAGQATIFSASEAAQAEGELARAGVSVDDILAGALVGSLNLAAAGQLDLATAAKITATSLNIFGLAGSDASRVADVLAAGANKSAAGVLDLGEGLQVLGPTAATLGISLEDSVAALALFADNGFEGSEAGNTLRRALLELSAPTAKQKDALDALNISFFDSQGKFIGLEAAAGVLQTGLKNLSDQERIAALDRLGGSFGLQALTFLYQAGAAKVHEYTDAVNDSGAAQRFASTQLDNLSGDLEVLSGSIETAIIKTGGGAQDVLRGLTQAATDSVNAFANLPSVTQGFAAGLLATTGAATAAIGVYGTLKPKFDEVTKSLSEGGRGAQFLGEHLGGIAKGALGLGAFFALQGPLQSLTGDLTTTGIAAGALAGTFISPGLGTVIGGTLGGIAGAVGLLGTEIDHTNEKAKSLAGSLSELEGAEARRDFFTTLGFSAAQLTKDFATTQTGVKKLADQFGSLETAQTVVGHAQDNIDAFGKVFRKLAEEAPVNAQKVLDSLKGLVPPDIFAAAQAAVERGTGIYQHHQDTLKGTQGATQALTGDTAALGGAADTTAGQIDNLKDALDGISGSSLDAEEADLAWVEALRTLNEHLDANNKTLEIGTEAGDKNRGVLESLTKLGLQHASAVFEQTGSLDTANGVLGEHITRLINDAAAHGVDRDAVIDYVAHILGIPAEKVTDIKNSADPARALVETYIATVNLTPGLKETTFVANTSQAMQDVLNLVGFLNSFGFNTGGGAVGLNIVAARFQTGGPVPGPLGAPLPAIVHGGEFVLSADVVRAIKTGGKTEGLAAAQTHAVTGVAASGGRALANQPLIGTLVVQGETPNALRVARETTRLARARVFRGG